jgi:acyl-CoA thioesterase I
VSAAADLGRLAGRRLGRIVALGDSLTADDRSWAEVLGEALSGAGAATVVNLGVGGDTTVHLVGRFADVIAAHPDIVLVMAGTNDARRHGSSARRMLVPDSETSRNLRWLCRLTREETRARVLLITPPPALGERIAVAREFRRERVSWRVSDIDRKAALVRRLGEPVIDSRDALRPPLARLLRADGLHLTPAGQERLARLVLARLAREAPAATPGRAGSRR